MNFQSGDFVELTPGGMHHYKTNFVILISKMPRDNYRLEHKWNCFNQELGIYQTINEYFFSTKKVADD